MQKIWQNGIVHFADTCAKIEIIQKLKYFNSLRLIDEKEPLTFTYGF